MVDMSNHDVTKRALQNENENENVIENLSDLPSEM